MKLNDYVEKFKRISFAESPFNEVDAAVLSQLAYLDFYLFAEIGYTLGPTNHGDLMWDLAKRSWEGRLNYDLQKALADSERFASTELVDMLYQSDLDQEIELIAYTFKLPDETYFISFRGSEANYLSWKENFNVLFMQATPSQKAALAYVKKMRQKMGAPFYLGGHSRGGQLAAYVGAHLDKDTTEHLKGVYCFDSPAVPNAELIKQTYKYVPEQTIVGLFLEQDSNYEIIEAVGSRNEQHSLHTWQISGTHFVRKQKLALKIRFGQNMLTQLNHLLKPQTKKRLINTIFDHIRHQLIDEIATAGPALLQAHHFKRALKATRSSLGREWLQVLLNLPRALWRSFLHAWCDY